MTIAMFFVVKELSQEIHLTTPIHQHTNSLSEPIYELTDVDGSFDVIRLPSLTLDSTMNEVSFIVDLSEGLCK